MTTCRDIVIWGATGQFRALSEFLASAGYEVVALVDRRVALSPLPDVPLLSNEAGLASWLERRQSSAPLFGAVAIGGAHGDDRIGIGKRLEMLGLTIAQLVHPTAFVAETAKLSASCQILPRAIVCSNVQVGDATILNSGALIEHDCVLGDGSHVGPGAIIAGEVVIGRSAFVGAGAIVLPRLEIGDEAIIGAGAVVTKSVPRGVTVIGTPARIMSSSL